MKILLSVIATLVVLAVGGTAFVYSGIYNVAADDPHNPIVRWAFSTTMHRSFAVRGSEIQPPPSYGPQLVSDGARLYESSCRMCHGAPGAAREDAAEGMRPSPPEYGHLAEHWSPGEIFWIVKHGIKMTGMPAWGSVRSDEEMWAIAAFVKEIPNVTPEEYRKLSGGSGSGHHGGESQGGHDRNSGAAAKETSNSASAPTHQH